MTEEEKRVGWFRGYDRVSSVANTYNGGVVDHKLAKELYNIGLLDTKGGAINENIYIN